MNIHSIAVKKRFYTSLKNFMRYLCFSGKDDIITWTVKTVDSAAEDKGRLPCGVMPADGNTFHTRAAEILKRG